MTHPTVPPAQPAQPHVDEADRALANILLPWVAAHRAGDIYVVQQAALVWLRRKGLT